MSLPKIVENMGMIEKWVVLLLGVPSMTTTMKMMTTTRVTHIGLRILSKWDLHISP